MFKNMIPSFRVLHLSDSLPLREVLDLGSVSLPWNIDLATERILHNARRFSGNHFLFLATALELYAAFAMPLFYVSFLVGGWIAINQSTQGRPDGHPLIPKVFYTGLCVTVLPLLWWALTLDIFFVAVGSGGAIESCPSPTRGIGDLICHSRVFPHQSRVLPRRGPFAGAVNGHHDEIIHPNSFSAFFLHIHIQYTCFGPHKNFSTTKTKDSP